MLLSARRFPSTISFDSAAWWGLSFPTRNIYIYIHSSQPSAVQQRKKGEPNGIQIHSSVYLCVYCMCVCVCICYKVISNFYTHRHTPRHQFYPFFPQAFTPYLDIYIYVLTVSALSLTNNLFVGFRSRDLLFLKSCT